MEEDFTVEGFNSISEDLKIVLSFLVDDVPEKWLAPKNTIFVFGHTDKRVAEHGAKLFLAGKSSSVIVSGGGRSTNTVPEGFSSEAEFYASVMEKLGVPKEAIFLETQASNSLENVLFGMKVLHEKNFHPKSVIVVSLPPQLRRLRATFAKHFPSISTFGSSFTTELSRKEWNRKRIRWVLAEIDRLKVYAQKGDIVPVSIPRQVEESCRAISYRI
ncbi:MAG: YdcF family protein [Parcubacteria group bacterium]|nr:YdcF family protein [Parcubacteria group bacterium]